MSKQKTINKNDRRMFSDDTLINTNNVSEMYEKLIKYEEATDEYNINIKWGKVSIIVKSKNSDLKL